MATSRQPSQNRGSSFACPITDAARLDELSTKAKRGELPPDEQVLLENYLHVGRLIDLMKSKARVSLKTA